MLRRYNCPDGPDQDSRLAISEVVCNFAHVCTNFAQRFCKPNNCNKEIFRRTTYIPAFYHFVCKKTETTQKPTAGSMQKASCVCTGIFVQTRAIIIKKIIICTII